MDLGGRDASGRGNPMSLVRYIISYCTVSLPWSGIDGDRKQWVRSTSEAQHPSLGSRTKRTEERIRQECISCVVFFFSCDGSDVDTIPLCWSGPVSPAGGGRRCCKSTRRCRPTSAGARQFGRWPLSVGAPEQWSRSHLRRLWPRYSRPKPRGAAPASYPATWASQRSMRAVSPVSIRPVSIPRPTNQVAAWPASRHLVGV